MKIHGVIKKKSQDLDLGCAFIVNQLCDLPKSVTSLDVTLFISDRRVLSGLPLGRGPGDYIRK